MRVATEHRVVAAAPGETVAVRVDVVNTGELIEGVTAHVIGLPDGQIAVEPQLLPLFPDAQGQLTLSITVPTHQPAGLHPLTIAVVSHGAGAPTQHVDVDLSVSARPDVRLSVEPQAVRAKRAGRFVVNVENAGNVVLDAELRASHEDKATRATFSPERLRVDPGVTSPVILTVRGPRMITGSEVDRLVAVALVAKRAHTIPAMDETETGPELTRETVVRLRQKPLVSRGLLTALILLSIICLWAAIFLLGLTKVLAGDPMTKTAPASFFPAAATTGGGGAGSESGGSGGAGGAGAGGDGGAPAGAMPKTGLLPAGVGGEVSGVVTATSNQLPTGRITVQAYRQGRDGLQLVSSAATQTDGTYVLAGLFPTDYKLKFSAAGFKPIWYPSASTQRTARPVSVGAQGKTEGINAVVAGLPASISGTLDPGASLQPVTTTVVARMVGAASDAKPAAQTTTSSTSYSLPRLPAPATYELSFSAPGYQVTKVLTNVSGGESRLQPTVVLGSGTGTISGLVTSDGVHGLGNVTVSASVAGQDVSVVTPTTGQVGAFTLDNLPTPGTYTLTFTSDGHGSSSEIVDLEAGQSHSGVDVTLVPGTNCVTGVVRDADGNRLGGAGVVVGGALQTGGSVDLTALPSTTTLTTGAVGSFNLCGLQAPGDYTLTFTLDGYAPETVPISLSGATVPPSVRVTMGNELGGIRGAVTGPSGAVYPGATVTATNGVQSWVTTSTAAGGALPGGGYLLGSLRPGTYSVTVTADGMRQQTALVRVTSGGVAVQDIRLRAVS